MVFRGMKSQLRSVIEWDNQRDDDLFWLWSGGGDEIKNASKLIVKPGQGVVFLYEGQIRAVHTEPGMYELGTDNIPFFTTVSKFMQAFESEHKTGIYYFSRVHFADQKWGTSSPVKYLDPVYNFPIGLRARGNMTFRIVEPESFFTHFVGSKSTFTLKEAREIITGRLQTPLVDLFAESGFSYIDIDKNREELASGLVERVKADYTMLGFELKDFRIEATDFDEETLKRVGRIADMTAEAAAASQAGLNYTQFQQLQALNDAARNEGGIAGIGVGMGAGLGLGNMFSSQMGEQIPSPVSSGLPTSSAKSPKERLQALKELYDETLITLEEYEKRKEEILQDL